VFKIIGNGSFAKAVTFWISSRNGIVSDEEYSWIVPCVPSYALKEIVLEKDKNILFVSKGIISDGLLVSEWAEKNNLTYAVIAGPHLASEIVQNLPTMCTIATKNQNMFSDIQNYFPCASYSNNPHLTCLAGVLKNIIAYACGVCVGLELGENAKACLIMLGIQEIITIADHLNIQNANLNQPGIIGDIILTAGSNKSRNFLGGYNRIKKIENNFLIESSHSCIELSNRIGKSEKWPILSCTADIIEQNLTDPQHIVNLWYQYCIP
jgi:glycerol-3-phosphate dehydrogenase